MINLCLNWLKRVIMIGSISLIFTACSKKEEAPAAPIENENYQSNPNTNQSKLYGTSLNDLVLNIISSKGKEQLLKISLIFVSEQVNINEIIQINKKEIIDIIVHQVSARNAEELMVDAGKMLLLEEIQDEINRILMNQYHNNVIKETNISDFIIK